MKSLRILVLLVAGMGSLGANVLDPRTEGIIILKAVAGYDAAATTFVSIQWVDRYSGYVVDKAGNKTTFVNEGIGRVIYFDPAYYDEVDHNQYWVDWRISIRSREAVMPPIDAVSLRPEDLPRLAAEEAILEDAIERYSNGRSLVEPLIDELKDQTAKLNSGLVLQNGNWIAAKDATVTTVEVPAVGDAETRTTFTTKDGKRFENAKVTVTDTGLSVLTDNGGASVAFDRLPDDLSPFPKTTQEKIIDWRNTHAQDVAETTPPAPTVTVTPTTTTAPTTAAAPVSTPLTLWGKIKQFVHHAVTGTWTYVASFGSSATSASSTASTAGVPAPAPAVAPAPAPAPAPKPTPAPVAVAATVPTPAPAPAAAPAKLPPAAPDLSNTVVLIKGDYSEGTGFLARTVSGPVVITNLHVVAANPNMKITTASGQEIVPLSMLGASDRDLAMFAIQDNGYHYLDLADDVERTATVGDAAVIPGNSEGGEVTLTTNGSVVGIGPQRVEFSNPIYHGNSGGPVLDVRTGKVVAVVTGAIEMKPTDEVDRQSFANANSAIKGPMRYFGLRLDTVPNWESYDQGGFVRETLFLKNFHDESRALDSYLNGKINLGANAGSEDGPPDAQFYRTNDKLRKADDDWRAASSGDDKATASQELVWNLNAMASADLGNVQNPSAFYAYDRERAKRELAYRQALIEEIQRVQSKIYQQGTTATLNSGL